ncbi:MAG TPA: hypothetical protein VKZ53_19565 [Candidatus Angelobacter sp.]|nr:hypothetical protein [Candidatus Angelobacter sp.]
MPIVAAAQQPVVADSLPGNDWCAKVNYADQVVLVASNQAPIPGEIWVSTAAGNSTCSAQVLLSPGRTLRFTQGGVFALSCSGILVQSVTRTIGGQPVVFPSQNVNIIGTSGAVLALPSGCANFSSPVHIQGATNVLVRDLEINGNGNLQQGGEQDHDISVVDSSQVKILNNYLHDAQGDAVSVFTDANMTAGCNDVLVEGNSFTNIGRHQVSLSGYGCNDFRVLGNYFKFGSAVTTSTSRGNAVHVEGETAGTGMQRITVAGNTNVGAQGLCYSFLAPTSNPILGLVVEHNQCSGTNINGATAAGIVVLMAQDVVIGGNTVNMTGSTIGTSGILVEEVGGAPAQANRIMIHNNVVEGVSVAGIQLFAAGTSTGTPQAFSINDNIVNNAALFCVEVINNFSDLDIHDNTCTNLQAAGMHIESAARFHIHHNTIRDYGLNGAAANGIEMTCNSVDTAIGPGEVDTNRIGNAVATNKTAIREDCSGANGIYVYHNDVAGNATGINHVAGGYVNGQPPF